ncbi:MAG: peptidylprolyl isomerase [Pseudomonadota bacterium]
MIFKACRQAASAAVVSSLVVLAVALPRSPAHAAPDDVVATVDGTPITERYLDLAAEEFAEQLQRVPADQRRRVLLDVLVDMTVLANAARQEKLNETAEFEGRMAFLTTRSLRNAFFRSRISGMVTEEDIKARYDKDLEGYEGPAETRASHILVKTEEEAVAVIAELDKGSDFAELAKEKSTGPSGPNGGDLGFFTKERMVKPFADAAFAMEPGTYSKVPVQTQFGWHVIKVEERRTQPKPALAEVEEGIRGSLVRERFAETLKTLKDAASIDIKEAPAE